MQKGSSWGKRRKKNPPKFKQQGAMREKETHEGVLRNNRRGFPNSKRSPSPPWTDGAAQYTGSSESLSLYLSGLWTTFKARMDHKPISSWAKSNLGVGAAWSNVLRRAVNLNPD